MGAINHPDRALAPWMLSMGGLVGVQLFFVLSGFLITRILLAERERTGKVDLWAFYRRRWARLYPSLLVVASVVVVLDPWSALRAVTYTSNILHGEHGRGLLTHSWSLSVEEQFYLAWPALLVLSWKRAKHVAVLGILLTVAAQMTGVLAYRATYYGLRWDALLAGCLIALTGFRGSARLFWPGLAVLTLLTLGAFREFQPGFYPLATAACVCAVASVRGASWLAVPWLVHVGRISYALYLWHGVTMRMNLPGLMMLALGWALAEGTYLLVDRRAQTRPRAS